jgi:tagatose 6-phosphate kinase
VIVTVTLNPVLHVRYDAERVAMGTVNQVSRVRYAAAGRGLVVARLLHEFGHDVVAAGLAGGSAGELIRNELSRAGVAAQFTRITAESRRQVRITDSSAGTATSFAEPAPYITTEELGRFAADYRGLLDGATAVVLCGSLPDGLPPEIYGSLTSYASAAGVPVILDAGGSALQHGAARGPALVIPELATAGPALEQLSPASVVLPAPRGVRVLTPGGEWLAEAGPDHHGPAGPAGLAPAAGPLAGFRDALVAGFVPGIALAWSWPDMLRHAVALAVSVSADGEADLAAYEALLPQVAVTAPPSVQARSA